MDSFELTYDFPVSASVLYNAWLDSEKHSQFTGSMAAIEARVDSYYTAWDGYITGKIIELEPQRRILQDWRTTDFPMDAENSKLDLTIKDKGTGCVLTLKHSDIPDGQGDQYKEGWNSHYFVPMNEYFSSLLN